MPITSQQATTLVDAINQFIVSEGYGIAPDSLQARLSQKPQDRPQEVAWLAKAIFARTADGSCAIRLCKLDDEMANAKGAGGSRDPGNYPEAAEKAGMPPALRERIEELCTTSCIKLAQEPKLIQVNVVNTERFNEIGRQR